MYLDSVQVEEAYVVKQGEFTVYFRERIVGHLKPGDSMLEKGLLKSCKAGIGCMV